MENFGDIEDITHEKSSQKKQLIPEPVDSDTSSLQEPIKETIKRDVKTVCTKLKFFFNFNKDINSYMEHEIRNYDLWGPFAFFLLFAVTSSIHQNNTESVFTTVIMVLTFGSFVLTLNSKLLSVNLSILQGDLIRSQFDRVLDVSHERSQSLQLSVPFPACDAQMRCGSGLCLLLGSVRV